MDVKRVLLCAGAVWVMTGCGGDHAVPGDGPPDALSPGDGVGDLGEATDTPDTNLDVDAAGPSPDAAADVLPTDGAIPVAIEETAEGWRLTRGGSPYVIKGVGGESELDLLVASGGNSIRTWGVSDETGQILDDAHARGLTVTLGLWLGHKEHGFDYQDAEAVAAQLEKTRADVLSYRDHPALLMWGVGNEVEIQDDDPAVWDAINEVAAMIHEVDPHHPTVVVTANLGEENEKKILAQCPEIDVWGINIYGGLADLDTYLDARDWTGPYVVTEFGPRGGWEVAKTAWGAVVEQSSAAKADHYLSGYEGSIATDGRCLGSYAFVWRTLEDPTDTWFGMLRPDGSPTPAVDAMTYAWTGAWPDDLAPEVTGFDSAADKQEVEAGSPVTATLNATDPEGGALSYTWFLRPEADDGLSWSPPSFCDTVGSDAAAFALDAPQTPGAYRLFGFAEDAAGKVGYASMPFRVAGDATGLPLWVDTVYAPSGWMGDATEGGLSLDECEHPDGACGGSACRAFTYTGKGQGWAGVFWQYPANNWGSTPGYAMPQGATSVRFRAWGAAGGETLNVQVGVEGYDGFQVGIDDLVLTTEPTEYTLPLEGLAYGEVAMGFGWSALAPPSGGMVFYITDIAWRAD